MNESPQTRCTLLVRIRDPENRVAWSEFVSIYEPLVYGFARKRGFQDADARDLCQDVLRAVAGAIDRWEPDPARGSFRGWLFRIARNLMVNSLEARRRNPRGTGETDMQRLLEERVSPDSEESTLFNMEYKRRLFQWAAEAIRDEFAESTWQAFWQTAVELRPVKDVADDLGLSQGAVYIARSRVIARLRERIEGIEQ